MQMSLMKVRSREFHCGDRVCQFDDPVHVGIVRAVLWTGHVRITWLGTGWVSDIELEDVRHENAPRNWAGEFVR